MFKSTERSVLLCQQLINFQSGGGSSEVGISDGKGIVNLNIFTQMDEPTKKDGIWIKTNHNYQRIMLNKNYLNEQNGVWSSVSTLPAFMYSDRNAIIYNGAIYILSYGEFYVFNGSTWSFICGFPYRYDNDNDADRMLVYKNEIYSIGVYGLYKFNGSNFVSLGDVPYRFGNGCAVVYNDEIHIFGGHDSSTSCKEYHYKYNGTTWTKVCDWSGAATSASAVVYNGKIYQLGGYIPYSNYVSVYTYSLSTGWKNANTYVPMEIFSCNHAIVFNNEIHVLGGKVGDGSKKHYKFNSSTWAEVSTLPYEFYYGAVVAINNEIHIIGGGYGGETSNSHSHYKFQAASKVYSPNTLILYKGDQHNGKYLTAIADTSAIIDDGKNNNRFISGFDDVIYFADTAFDWTAPMYYGDGTQWIKFKN